MSEYITERKDLVHLQRHIQQSLLLDEEYEEKRINFINHVSFKEKEKEKELSLSFKKKEEQLRTSLRSLLARLVLSTCEKENYIHTSLVNNMTTTFTTRVPAGCGRPQRSRIASRVHLGVPRV